MKIGLLPLYVRLYDEVSTEYRQRMEQFYQAVARKFLDRRIEVVTVPICTVKREFDEAVAQFETAGCDAIVTLHLAYSPSLESIEALRKTKLPIIVLDTTPTDDFSSAQSPDEIMYCHGIHGVMDMCNLLQKNRKSYAIVAGPSADEHLYDRAAGLVKAACCANSVAHSSVGTIGGYFDGMGDFQLSSEQLLERFGVTTVTPQTNELTELHQSVREEEIQAEIESDLLLGVDCPAPSDLRYRESICTDLTLRKWIEKHQLHAFTINFRDLEELRTMPFMEICKAMARGIGYAGEGDCLTAVFTGALLTAYEQTSFVEIFCPDWKHNTLLISHMGEMNFRCAKGKIEFFEKEFVFGNAPNPIAGTACFQSGEAIFVNIFQDASGFHMLYSPVSVIEEETDYFRHNIRGWIRPEGTIASFLENISKYGGTHHSILVYHATCEEMEFFADCLNINPIRIA